MSIELSPAVEVSPAAYFSGEGLVAPTRVLHAELDAKNSVYFLNPMEDSKSCAQEPTVALVVENTGTRSNKQVKDLFIDKLAPTEIVSHDADTIAAKFAEVAAPDMKLTFEGGDGIAPKHLAMLAYTAMAHKLPTAEIKKAVDADEVLTLDGVPVVDGVYLCKVEDVVSNDQDPAQAIIGFANHVLRMANIKAIKEA